MLYLAVDDVDGDTATTNTIEASARASFITGRVRTSGERVRTPKQLGDGQNHAHDVHG